MSSGSLTIRKLQWHDGKQITLETLDTIMHCTKSSQTIILTKLEQIEIWVGIWNAFLFTRFCTQTLIYEVTVFNVW